MIFHFFRVPIIKPFRVVGLCVLLLYPIGSMYGPFTYIYHKNQPNVGKYTSPMDPMGFPLQMYILSFLVPLGTFKPRFGKQGCRFVPHTFSETNKATDGTKLDLNIGETRVWL